jgi:hypothetical protein
MPLADAVVVAVEQHSEVGVERREAALAALEHERLEEPGDMREVPLGGARVRHGLHLAVLVGERARERERSGAHAPVLLGERGGGPRRGGDVGSAVSWPALGAPKALGVGPAKGLVALGRPGGDADTSRTNVAHATLCRFPAETCRCASTSDHGWCSSWARTLYGRFFIQASRLSGASHHGKNFMPAMASRVPGGNCAKRLASAAGVRTMSCT